MAIQDTRPTARSNESMQGNVSRSEPAIGVSYGLVGALVVFGGLGYLLDGWLDTTPWVTHRVPFDQTVEQFPTWLRPESKVIKAMVSL